MSLLEETPFFAGSRRDWANTIGARSFHNAFACGRRLTNGTWAVHLNVPMVMHGQVWDAMDARAVTDDFGALVVFPDPVHSARPNVQ